MFTNGDGDGEPPQIFFSFSDFWDTLTMMQREWVIKHARRLGISKEQVARVWKVPSEEELVRG